MSTRVDAPAPVDFRPEPQVSVVDSVTEVLRLASSPLTIDQICLQVFGTVGERQRGSVRLNLHRLDEKGRLEKFAMRYKLRD